MDRCRLAAAAIALALLPHAALHGQVGHDPAVSPFRDVTTRQSITAFVGLFPGNEANAGVGARSGTIAGLRFQTRLSGTLDLTANLAGITGTRYVVNPDSPLTSRTTGPIGYDRWAVDVGLGFNLTGQKTWRRLAPFIGIAVGVMVPTEPTTDPGGYEARENFVFVPSLGTRVALGRSLWLHAEVRDYFLRYEWPLAYFTPTNTAVPPVLDADRDGEKDWASHFALTLGLSYRFNF